MFEDLKGGLAAPLAGMGISFSSSLFGLAGSLVLGFLDLQAGQAQNRFYNELEDWLSTTVIDHRRWTRCRRSTARRRPAGGLDRLTVSVLEQGGGAATRRPLANLAEGIQALVQHMRTEQQLIRDWVEAQAGREADMKRVLERIAAEPDRAVSWRAHQARAARHRLLARLRRRAVHAGAGHRLPAHRVHAGAVLPEPAGHRQGHGAAAPQPPDLAN